MHKFDDIHKQHTQIIGIGTDLCEIKRIAHLYHKFGDHFLRRIFSEQENKRFHILAESQKIPFLAKRFAAKEAVAKALQTGIGKGAFFTHISCLNDMNKAPYITLSNHTHIKALELAKANNFSNYHIYISLSDETEYAQAFTILVGLYES